MADGIRIGRKFRPALLSLLLAAGLAACQSGAGQGGEAGVSSAEAGTAGAGGAVTEAAVTEAAVTEAAGAEEQVLPALEDGLYSAEFHTDSAMFHVNEAHEGRGLLTVADGKMTIHISLPSQNIRKLYPGSAEDAQKEGAEALEAAEDEVRYPDGLTETVSGFDIPVPGIDVEFPLAVFGKKGKWYDHVVSVSNPEKKE